MKHTVYIGLIILALGLCSCGKKEEVMTKESINAIQPTSSSNRVSINVPDSTISTRDETVTVEESSELVMESTGSIETSIDTAEDSTDAIETSVEQSVESDESSAAIEFSSEDEVIGDNETIEESSEDTEDDSTEEDVNETIEESTELTDDTDETTPDSSIDDNNNAESYNIHPELPSVKSYPSDLNGIDVYEANQNGVIYDSDMVNKGSTDIPDIQYNKSILISIDMLINEGYAENRQDLLDESCKNNVSTIDPSGRSTEYLGYLASFYMCINDPQVTYRNAYRVSDGVCVEINNDGADWNIFIPDEGTYIYVLVKPE